ncbi:Cytoplasmic phosphatidylinositol transfer protein 1, partial [Acropora cervicornis]
HFRSCYYNTDLFKDLQCFTIPQKSNRSFANWTTNSGNQQFCKLKKICSWVFLSLSLISGLLYAPRLKVKLSNHDIEGVQNMYANNSGRGQLYMISKHSHEQSDHGEGVHVVKNEPCEDEKYGKGQFTEKRVYLSSRLPAWMRSYIPKIFYVEEKAWNYYPYTITVFFSSKIFNKDTNKDNTEPIMCSYKLVSVSFDVWALASRVESFVHRIIQDILLLGHRQAFAWIDSWIDMDIEDVRDYEKDMHEKTNHKVGAEI